MKKSTNLFLKASLGYTLGNILIRGISFVTLPIFSRIMSTSDFGVYSAAMSVASLLCLVMNFAVHVSLPNANVDFPGKLREFASSLVLLTILTALPYVFVSLIFGSKIGTMIGIMPMLVPLLVVESFGMALLSIYNSLLAQEYRYKEYIAISFVYTILNAGLSILLILTAYEQQRYMGRFIGGLIAMVLLAAYIIASTFKGAAPRNNRSNWTYALKISFPIVPHGISQVLIAQFDRIMLLNLISQTAAGIYSFAFTIASIYQIVFASLETTWTPWFFSKMKSLDLIAIKKRSAVLVIVTMMATCAGISIAPEIIAIVGGSSYFAARDTATLLFASMFFSYLYSFPVGIQYYRKKTVHIAAATAIVAVVKIAVNYAIIPTFGYFGAAVTTMMMYLLYFIMHYTISKSSSYGELFDDRTIFASILFVLAWTGLNLLLRNEPIVRILILAVLIAVCAFVFVRKKEAILEAVFERSSHTNPNELVT